MAKLAVIRKGDRTSHGGVVINGDAFVQVFGQPMARKGDQVSCPRCGGVHAIIEGVFDATSERQLAVEGMKTACGATLIASQQFYKVDNGQGVGSDRAMALGQGLQDDGKPGQKRPPRRSRPDYCELAHNVDDFTLPMFDRVRKQGRYTEPVPANIPPLIRQEYEYKSPDGTPIFPIPKLMGRKIEVFVGPARIDVYDLPRVLPPVRRNGEEVLWRVPTFGELIHSLYAVPPALFAALPKTPDTRSVLIRICDELSDRDQKERREKYWPGVPYRNQLHSFVFRRGGDAKRNHIRLFPLTVSAKFQFQATLDRLVMHEVAHHYHTARNIDVDGRWARAGDSDGCYPSGYATRSPTEDFAEFVVMAVVLEGTPCGRYARKVFPARYAYFDELGILD